MIFVVAALGLDLVCVAGFSFVAGSWPELKFFPILLLILGHAWIFFRILARRSLPRSLSLGALSGVALCLSLQLLNLTLLPGFIHDVVLWSAHHLHSFLICVVVCAAAGATAMGAFAAAFYFRRTSRRSRRWRKER